MNTSAHLPHSALKLCDCLLTLSLFSRSERLERFHNNQWFDLMFKPLKNVSVQSKLVLNVLSWSVWRKKSNPVKSLQNSSSPYRDTVSPRVLGQSWLVKSKLSSCASIYSTDTFLNSPNLGLVVVNLQKYKKWVKISCHGLESDSESQMNKFDCEVESSSHRCKPLSQYHKMKVLVKLKVQAQELGSSLIGFRSKSQW